MFVVESSEGLQQLLVVVQAALGIIKQPNDVRLQRHLTHSSEDTEENTVFKVKGERSSNAPGSV